MKKASTLPKIILWIVVVAAVIAGGGIWWFLNIPVVETVTPTRGPAVQAIYATGNVEATNWAKVTPQVTARIMEHCACEGQTVKKGDELAKLDDQEARANLAETRAREEFLAQELNRYLRLSGQQVVSEQVYQRVASEYAQARAATAAAEERLSRYVLTSPLDGIVLRRDGEVGEVAAPGDVLFWVGEPRPLRIVADVDEEDIPSVRLGQKTLIKSDAFPGQTLTGSVNHVTPKGDPVNKSYRVRVSLPDDTPLMIGMTTEINIIVREVEYTMLIPTDAVSNGSVWVAVNDRVQRRPVKTGIRGGQQVEILEGLTQNDTVLAAPPEGLEDGDRIRVASGS